jgi:hypothetical protein
MSDKKISQLDEKSSLESGDYTIIVDHNDNTTKKVQALVFKGDQGDTGAQGLPGVGWQRDGVNGFTYPSFLTDKIGIGTDIPLAKLGIIADNVTYTCPDVTGSINFDSGSFEYGTGDQYYNDGYQHCYRIWVFYDSPLGRVYSPNYLESDYITDNSGSSAFYTIPISWPAPTGTFTGYVILKYDTFSGYNFDAGWEVYTNSLTDSNNMGDGYDTSITSASSYGDALNATGSTILTGALTQSGLVSMGYNGDFNINDQGSVGIGIGSTTPQAYVELGKCSGGWGAHLRFTRVGYNTVDVRMAGAPDGFIFRNFDTTSGVCQFSFRDSGDTHFWDMYQGGWSCFKGASNDNVYSVQIGGTSSLRTVGKAYFATTVGIGESSPTGILHVKNTTLAEAKTYLNIYGGAINIGKLDTDSSGNIRMNLYNSAGNAKVHLDTAGVSYITGGSLGVGVSSPTANLHLKAGTATVSNAPLKFTSGVNLTIPEAGTIEFDGTDFYLTI